MAIAIFFCWWGIFFESVDDNLIIGRLFYHIFSLRKKGNNKQVNEGLTLSLLFCAQMNENQCYQASQSQSRT